MIVQLTGGLGNQMFGYAFGRSLSLARGEEVFFTRNQVDGNTHGGYGLDAFMADIKFTDKLAAPIYKEPSFRFDPNAVKAAPGSSYAGYWQSPKYFNEPIVREDFRFNFNRLSPRVTEELAPQILSERTAFIHVRRGDYLKEPHKSWHGNLPTSYYQSGEMTIQAKDPNAEFIVFSDDSGLCEFMGHKVVKGTTPIEDMWLMSLCKHAVIANSSFSWWAAYLGDNKQGTIVAPKKWFETPTLDTSDLIPERWIRI